MALLLMSLASTLVMTGVIWFVQVVHYPLFAGVGEERFVAYAAVHSRTTSWVVAPPMVLELTSAILLLAKPPDGVSSTALQVALGLTVVTWLATFLLSVPMHTRLATAFDRDAWRRLVATNWVRTAAWTARSALLLVVVWKLLDR